MADIKTTPITDAGQVQEVCGKMTLLQTSPDGHTTAIDVASECGAYVVDGVCVNGHLHTESGAAQVSAAPRIQ